MVEKPGKHVCWLSFTGHSLPLHLSCCILLFFLWIKAILLWNVFRKWWVICVRGKGLIWSMSIAYWQILELCFWKLKFMLERVPKRNEQKGKMKTSANRLVKNHSSQKSPTKSKICPINPICKVFNVYFPRTATLGTSPASRFWWSEWRTVAPSARSTQSSCARSSFCEETFPNEGILSRTRMFFSAPWSRSSTAKLW